MNIKTGEGYIVGYFGKEGSFSNQVAKKRYPKAKHISCGSIKNCFQFAKKSKNHLCIVPIENSSAGIIPETVNELMVESGLKKRTDWDIGFIL